MSINAAISIMLQHVTNGAKPEMLEVSLGPLRTSTSVPLPPTAPFLPLAVIFVRDVNSTHGLLLRN